MKPTADYRIAILRDDLPEFDLARAQRTASLLEQAGFAVDAISAKQLADANVFNANKYGLLLLTSSKVFPAEAIDNLQHYLQAGGDMALMGGRSFDRLVMEGKGSWLDFDAMRSHLAAGNELTPMPLFDQLDLKDWSRIAENGKAKSQITQTRFRRGKAIELDLKSVEHYDSYKAKLESAIPAGHNVMVLWTKAASPKTKQAVFELKTKDGARWIATLDMQTRWQPIVLKPADFMYYEGGNSHDVHDLKFNDVVKLSFGLAKDFGAFEGEDHTLTMTILGTAKLSAASDGKVQDLRLYNDYASFQYADAREARSDAAANAWLKKPLTIPGPITGSAAFAIPRAGVSQAYPILTTQNRKNQTITAANVLVHYNGPYRNAQWFSVGCEEASFYEQSQWDELLVKVVSRMREGAWLEDAKVGDAFADATRMQQIIGVTHAGAKYHFTDKGVLNEGAKAIEQLGTRTIKLWIPRPKEMYRFNHDWSEDLKSMVDVLRTPAWSEVLSGPFDTYYLEAFAMPRRLYVLDRGVDDEERAWITKEFEDVTRHLLTTYKGTGKTFVLQNWEGDWALRTAMDPNQEPTLKRIQAMIDWLNARQDGVDRARNEVGEDGVRVLHAAETNLVLQQMKENRAGVVRDVLPHTRVDLVSYSCYDTRGDAQAFRAAIEYMAMHLPETSRKDLPNRVVIGEFGVPETTMGIDAVKRMLPEQVEIATAYGCPHLLYWALYCNELNGEHDLPVKHNDQVNGFWLIKPDGSRAWAWDYLASLMKTNQK